MQLLLQNFSRADPNGAFAMLAKMDDLQAVKTASHGILENLSVRDPKAAMAALANLPPGVDPKDAYSTVFGRTVLGSPYDPLAAAAADDVLKLPPGPARDGALQGVVNAWGFVDPTLALNWALTLPPSDNSALVTALGFAARKDPELAAKYVDKLEDASARNSAIGAIGVAMSHKDPAAALDWLNQVATGATYDNTVTSIFASLSRPERVSFTTANGLQGTSFSGYTQDLPGAMALLDKVSDPAIREKAIGAMAGNWALSNPQEALSWANALPQGDATARSDALRTIIGTWGKTDPAAAVAYVQNSADPSVYLEAAPGLAQNLSKSNPQAALAFAGSLPDGTAQSQAVNNVLVQMSQRDFNTAWNYAAQLPAGGGRDTTMANLVGVQAKQDPVKAVALLDQLPSAAAQLAATRALGATWAQQDPRACSEWISALPAGDVRDTAAVQLISSQVKKSPADVIAWANSLTNPDLRAAQVQSVLTAWAAKDPQAALAAAQSANLPDAQRAALVQMLAQSQTR